MGFYDRDSALFMEYDDENEISPSDIEPLEDPIMKEDDIADSSTDSNRKEEEKSKAESKYSSVPDLWEELHGNYVLRPENFSTDPASSQQPPRALIHFLGGALIGAAPDISYRYLLERLAKQGYLIVATPFNLSFDYLSTCDSILDRFERIAPMLARQYGAVPVVGVGHSCGALLHLIITSLFPDTPRAANALLSYNNKDVKDAVPLFDTLVAPAFQSIASNQTGTNGVETIQLWNNMVKTTLNGEIPSDDTLREFTEALLPPPLQNMQSSNNNILSSLITIPAPLRETLQSTFLHPFTNTLSETSLLPPIRQSIDVLDQIPLLIQEVADGASEFNPSRESIQAATKRAYRARRTLLIQYKNDPLDESPEVESLLNEAETVMRMKRPMVTMDCQRVELDGNHATPVLAPPGVEFTSKLEDALGRNGKMPGSASENDVGEDGSESSGAGVAILYKQVDDTVDVLVKWLEDGLL